MTTNDQDNMIVKLRKEFKLTLFKAKMLLEEENYNYTNAAKRAKAEVNESNTNGKQLLHD